jgi:isoleucyl-tRNA synthetase
VVDELNVYRREEIAGFINNSDLSDNENNYVLVSSKTALNVFNKCIKDAHKNIILVVPNQRLIEEVKRKFFGTLYNTYSFFVLYANIDKFDYSEDEIEISSRPEIDRWILSELNTLIKNVDKFYSEYEPTKVARTISDFTVEILSNWYVRLSRRRFWKGDYESDKISAYQTLYTCLITISKLAAPIAPFFMDKLFLDLTKNISKIDEESVHLTTFPVSNELLIDSDLERKMKYAQKISSLTLSLRAK